MFQYVETNEPTVLKFVDFLGGELRWIGVEVRLGERVTASQVAAAKPDVVVLAPGARYCVPFNLIFPRLLGTQRASGRLSVISTRPFMRRLFYDRLRTPDIALERGLRALGVEVRRIGDCHRPGKTPEAMTEAAEVAFEP